MLEWFFGVAVFAVWRPPGDGGVGKGEGGW